MTLTLIKEDFDMEASNVVPIIGWLCLFVWGLSLLSFMMVIFKMTFFEKDYYNFNLTKEDFDFLLDLQNEMLTQDHVCQAAPRFWVVATDTFEELGTEDSYDGVNLYSYEGAEIVCKGDMQSILEYVNENYSEELENITFTDKGRFYHVEFGENDNRDEDYIYDAEDLLMFLKKQDILSDDYEFVYYRHVHHVYPNTMFLTNRSCKEHIKANHYHYNSDAHSYAMTAWRSPEVERLFEILDKINWQKVKEVSDVDNKK